MPKTLERHEAMAQPKQPNGICSQEAGWACAEAARAQQNKGGEMSCPKCQSYAINPHLHGRDDTHKDLCDVCFWRAKHDELQAKIKVEIEYLDKCRASGLVQTYGAIQSRMREWLN